MKTFLIFLASVGICTVVACSGVGENSAVNPFTENLEILTPPPSLGTTSNYYKSKAWTEGLIDHLVRNNASITVTYEQVKNLDYTAGSVILKPQHFRVIHTVNDPLMGTIRNYIKNIDGIFLGTITTGSSINPNVQMIISLAMVDTLSVPSVNNCNLIDKVTYFREKGTSIHFKCSDPNLGIWQRIPENDPLMDAYRKKPAGVFIGKSNLFNTIFKLRNNMFFYTGFDIDGKRHFVAVDKPYFTDPTYISKVYDIKSEFQGVYNPPKTLNVATNEGLYFSTLRGDFHCLRFQTSSHGTTRLCPNNCPQ
jgi:hypothetical protein